MTWVEAYLEGVFLQARAKAKIYDLSIEDVLAATWNDHMTLLISLLIGKDKNLFQNQEGIIRRLDEYEKARQEIIKF